MYIKIGRCAKYHTLIELAPVDAAFDEVTGFDPNRFGETDSLSYRTFEKLTGYTCNVGEVKIVELNIGEPTQVSPDQMELLEIPKFLRKQAD